MLQSGNDASTRLIDPALATRRFAPPSSMLQYRRNTRIVCHPHDIVWRCSFVHLPTEPMLNRMNDVRC
jgi:hypothetical protein